MLERGVVVSHETIRRWCAKFGQAYANQLRRRRPRLGESSNTLGGVIPKRSRRTIPEAPPSGSPLQVGQRTQSWPPTRIGSDRLGPRRSTGRQRMEHRSGPARGRRPLRSVLAWPSAPTPPREPAAETPSTHMLRRERPAATAKARSRVRQPWTGPRREPVLRRALQSPITRRPTCGDVENPHGCARGATYADCSHRRL
jgi:hypothetical protein